MTQKGDRREHPENPNKLRKGTAMEESHANQQLSLEMAVDRICGIKLENMVQNPIHPQKAHHTPCIKLLRFWFF